ncbi:hypothetical protein JX265_003829 [Neoarthrinium moseri]|uniref:Uncharacterized protein n=1 Tax=Neoarthrinium moseri TaxID=1658444 RepID=A0A9P9WR68_9PEZI|nr:uncharacterized protein JN550_009393 [Neoarthrinium moseri]KAI1852403.1 hypothetical protein JX266_002581 [Neoarthrinium moseri]KAI1863693.1 hypothetical protein JN550_009393 [Neoarthrinium moseri]KAI1876303.1 hypothetical protein JX265_003829 [Neoarthrinium moseri]
MASKQTEEKASQPGHLAVHTTELQTQNGAALSPVSTSNSLEKGPKETSIDMPRNSANSSPSSARRLSPFDTDVEAGQSSENLNRKSTQFTGRTLNNPNCSVWPGQDHWKQKARAAKLKNRSCKCMAHLSKRTRLVVKILMAALIIGIAVAVGLGVSKSLGAGIWKPQGQ